MRHIKARRNKREEKKERKTKREREMGGKRIEVYTKILCKINEKINNIITYSTITFQ